MPRYDATSIGEGGLRLSVPAGTRLERTSSFAVAVIGTELNVLCGLASLGWHTSWVSAVPDSSLGRLVESTPRSRGVDITHLLRVPDSRVGKYFVEYGCPPRPTQVLFDRKGTAFSQLTPSQVDWAGVLDTRLLHLSGLTAALSDSVADVLRVAVDGAARAGVPVCFDVNYRETLWAPQDAAAALRPYVEAADVLFCRSEDARLLYNLGPDPEKCLLGLQAMSSARHLVVSCGEDGVWTLGPDGCPVHTPAVPVSIVDRLGAGDGLAAGFLHGLLAGDEPQAPRYATAMAALALSQDGEQVTTTRSELKAVMDDPSSELHR